MAGDPATGARVGAEGCRILEQVGDKGWLSTASAEIAECLAELGQLDEAYALTVRSEELGASDDMANEERWRQARARILAKRGAFEEAERLAREALAISGQMQHPDGWAFMTMGDVLEHAGKTDEATEWYRRALESFEEKGIVAWADYVSERLRSLGELDE